MLLLRLAIASPLRTAFDYIPPNGVDAAALVPGVRVRVPFGPRSTTGWLVSVVTSTDVPRDKLRSAIEILDDEPLIDSDLLDLCHWAASYYHHPLGEVLPAAFPSALRKGGVHTIPGQICWRLTARGQGLPPGAPTRAPKQAAALALMRERGAVAAIDFAGAGIQRAVLRELSKKELAEEFTSPPVQREAQGRAGLLLGSEQAAAVTAVEGNLGRFGCFLLEGVTGSGKTEVYLQLIDRCLAQGRQALVLIPEIGLTPQTLTRFRERFDAELALLHSGLAEGERYRAWDAARSGHAHIIIGTRSAVFAPLAKPGLIIVDEEHDGSYKQMDGFRYSARDVAIKRAQLHGVPVLLGSATPSLESIANAADGRYTLLRLNERAGGGALPPINALDIRRAPLQTGFSAALLDAVQQTLQQGNQVLLFLNRRGYAPQLQCHDCGWTAQCDHCDARYTVHRSEGRLLCHHCGASTVLPRRCPSCHCSNLTTAGLGTEQVQQFLHQHFPATAVHRVDRDVIKHRDAMADLVTAVNEGGPCILLGTQMLAKGHHFPKVALAAILDTDAGLFSTDFRGEERMAQLLTQVAGRAGRAETSGQVLLQTHYPEHPAVQSLLHLRYDEYARQLLDQRRESGMPPWGFLALVRVDSSRSDSGEQFLLELRRQLEGRLPGDTIAVGPLPAPLARRAGKYRHQLLLRAGQRSCLQQALDLLVHVAEAQPRSGALRWSLDVDPQDAF